MMKVSKAGDEITLRIDRNAIMIFTFGLITGYLLRSWMGNKVWKNIPEMYNPSFSFQQTTPVRSNPLTSFRETTNRKQTNKIETENEDTYAEYEI